MGEAPPSGGLLASLRGLAATLLETLQTRLQLLGVELEEEKRRLLRILAYGAMALVLLAVGLLFLAFFIVILFWDDHRLLAFGLVTALFLGGGSLALLAALRALRRPSPLFSASLNELAQDRAELGRDRPQR